MKTVAAVLDRGVEPFFLPPYFPGLDRIEVLAAAGSKYPIPFSQCT